MANPIISQSSSIPGHLYEATITLSDMEAGSFTVLVGETRGTPRTAAGTHTELFLAATAEGLQIEASSDVNGFVDSASFKLDTVAQAAGTTSGSARVVDSENGDIVASLLDRTPYANNLNQPDALRRPVLVVDGGRRGLKFDGLNDFVQTDMNQQVLPETGNFSVFAVLDTTLLNNNSALFGCGDRSETGFDDIIFYASSAGVLRLFSRSASSSTSVQGATNIKNTGVRFVGLVRRGNTFEAYLDGQIDGSQESLKDGGGPVSIATGLIVGAASSTQAGTRQFFLPAKVFALNAYQRALSATEIQKLKSYYYSYYGLE